MPTKRKPPYSIRLSPEARKLLDQLARKLKHSKGTVVEVALRELAAK